VSSSVGVLYNMSVAGVRVVEFDTYLLSLVKVSRSRMILWPTDSYYLLFGRATRVDVILCHAAFLRSFKSS